MDYEIGIRLERIERLVAYLVEEYEKGKKKPNKLEKQEEEDKVR